MIEFVRTIRRYRNAYRNWIGVLLRLKLNNYPIRARTRASNKILELGNRMMAYNISWFEILGYQIIETENGKCVTIEFDNEISLKFWGAIYDGDLQGIFGQNIYGNLDYSGKSVIDIGANIGDSSIYFALRGSKHVYALEPFRKAYEYAIKNVLENGLADIVTVLNAGIGIECREIHLDEKTIISGGERALDKGVGYPVQIITLEEILKKYDVSDAILKLDCEGCEYDVIENATPVVLNTFTDILIEYHFGIQDIVIKLRRAGFKVNVSPRSRHVGDIVATKRFNSENTID